MKRIGFMLSTSLLSCAIAAQPALAQSTAGSATPSASGQADESGQQLQDIIVTAERRTSTAQKTAASVSVRSGTEMLERGRYELKNILEDVPGVVGGAATSTNSSSGGGSDNPAAGLTIRGIQSNSGAGGSITSTAASAAIYVDDVYNGIGGGYDIDRVEVLRGPQGTLYGRSATAGVVAIHTQAPDTTTVSAQGTAEFGNYNLIHIAGGVNVPVIQDKLAVRVSGNLYERDGYYSADGDARSSKSLRAKALWTPTDNFSALVGYAQEYNVTHSGGLSITQTDPAGDYIYQTQDYAPAKNHFRQYWANFQLDLGAVAVTYIPAYRTWFQDATLYGRGVFNSNQTIYTPKDNFMTHEFRIRSNDSDSKLKWQAGFLYYRNYLENTNNLYSLDLNNFIFKSTSQKTTTAAGAFAEATYSFTPETRLTGGIRYDYTRIRNLGDYTSITGETKSLTGDEGLRTFNNVTYKARLEHDLTPQNLIYASISTGFSPGDVTLTTDADSKPVAQTLKAQTLTAYEIGTKNRFLGNKLQVNLTAFYYDYGGYQTAGVNITPDTPLNQTYATLSSPVKSYGGELEVQARPWENGTFSFNAAYTHARYGGFGEYQYLFSKDEIPNVPAFQGSAAYDHHIPIGEASLMLHGDLRYFTHYDTMSIPEAWADQGGEAYIRVPARAIANLSASLAFGSKYSITAYVRNVADTRYRPNNWIVTSTGGAFAGTGNNLSDPRTYGLVLNVKY
ncbi:putative outer membrane salicin receptor [Novosphingobium sp. Rr 2-17]|uniref:TonB-dependent receptor n=1 Tax=Novosphingobium sp. Rr 2-17 TaxID=555793 RepID=UPI000269825D|nr:TonB-dependent receptor [Novosphingobium sp. Rr 2-17]EIZ77730.1 putative outer membrane salicin receptor [Novosphingobium sp. Rr 2-17]